METSSQPTKELTVHLRISLQAWDELTRRASASGKEISAVASELIEQVAGESAGEAGESPSRRAADWDAFTR